MARKFKVSLFVIIDLSYYIDKPPPHVVVMIAGPLYLGSQQPDCNTGLWLVGAHPKPSFLLESCLEVSVISLIDVT